MLKTWKNCVSTSLVSVLAASVSIHVSAEEQSGTNAAEKVAGAAAVTADVTPAETAGLASQLARYGEAHKDPLALIAAAKMIRELGDYRALEATKTTEGEALAAAGDKAPSADPTPDLWIDQAKKFAEGNEDLLAMADAIASMETRGASRGPVRVVDTVLAGNDDIWTITFRASERAQVFVDGDGDTDLDLFVFDEHGNEICRDDDETDTMFCDWRPRWTGTFRVVVRNLGGVWNQYTLLTN